MDALLVFPNQLFARPKEKTTLFLLEDEHFFSHDIIYHKHKIMLHRASMKAYFRDLFGDKRYICYPFSLVELKEMLKGFDRVLAYDPIDYDIKDTYESLGIHWLERPDFMTDTNTIEAFFKGKSTFLMHEFYAFQRKRLDILMEQGKPIGGRYSFDTRNRKKLPANLDVPKPLVFNDNPELKDAALWTNRLFPDNPGETTTFNHPVTRSEALRQLDFFLDEKLIHFGPYQDAFSKEDPFLFHSDLSSSINIGLISAEEVVMKARTRNVPIESKEGFIRQLIGWREFMRAVYVIKGRTMRSQNVLGHHNKLSKAWYEKTTGIPVLDQTIHKLLTHAYSHHIERLMVLGNLMMLTNIDPNEVYVYFMATHIDAYPWVMIPNIYGMSQFACGPMMTTKPYFSGSNYLLRMGVDRGPWIEVWDALFYLFLKKERDLIQNNPRLGVLIKNLDRKSQSEIDRYESIKKTFLAKVTRKP